MLRKLLLFLLIYILFGFTQDSGHFFPEIQCGTLDGKTMSFPTSLRGKYSILGFSMSNQAEESLKTWFKPVFYSFIYKPKKEVLFRTSYDVNLYFVSMYSESNNSGYSKAKAKYNVGLDKKLKPYILMFQGDMKSIQRKLAANSCSVPYIFLLNQKGEIVYQTQGNFSESKMMKIEDILDGF